MDRSGAFGLQHFFGGCFFFRLPLWPSLWLWGIAGLCLSMAMLLRKHLYVLFPVLLLGVAFHYRRESARALGFALTFSLVVAANGAFWEWQHDRLGSDDASYGGSELGINVYMGETLPAHACRDQWEPVAD